MIIKRILHGFNTQLVEKRDSLSLFKQSFYLQFYMYVFPLFGVLDQSENNKALISFICFDKSL